MTSLFSNINIKAAEQHSFKQKQSLMLFTFVEGLLSKAGIARLPGESGKIVCCIRGTVLPRNEVKDLVTINHPAMGREYAEVRNQFVF